MLKEVVLLGEAHLTLLCHALSTEHEEIAGALIGYIEEEDRGEVAYVTDLFTCTRTDRKADRVEISGSQLAAAATQAEQLMSQRGRQHRVIGWYHSHPKFTVWPSHVDLRTQHQHQALDSSFVGLIVSCFDIKLSKISIAAFQSLYVQASSMFTRIDVPLRIGSYMLTDSCSIHALPALLRNLLNEERSAFDSAISNVTHPLHLQYNNSLYAQSLAHLIDAVALPLLRSLRSYRTQLEQQPAMESTLDGTRATQAGGWPTSLSIQHYANSPNLLAPSQTQKKPM